MKTLNKWFLAGLIGLSLAGGVQAAPVIDQTWWSVVQTDYPNNWETPPPRLYYSFMEGINVGDGYSWSGGVFVNGITAGDYTGVPLADANPGLGNLPYVMLRDDAYTRSVYEIAGDPQWSGDFSEAALGKTALKINVTGTNLEGDNVTVRPFFVSPLSGTYQWAWIGPALTLGQDNTIALEQAMFTRSVNEFPVSPEDWNANIADVFGFGLLFWGNFEGDETFSTSNYQLISNDNPVPEPETVWMIVAVLASLAVTFRRQLIGMVVKA